METARLLSQRQNEPGCVTALCSFHGSPSSDSSNRDTVRQHDCVIISHSPSTTDCLSPVHLNRTVCFIVYEHDIIISHHFLNSAWMNVIRHIFTLIITLQQHCYSYFHQNKRASCSSLENNVISDLTQQLFYTQLFNHKYQMGPRCKLEPKRK